MSHVLKIIFMIFVLSSNALGRINCIELYEKIYKRRDIAETAQEFTDDLIYLANKSRAQLKIQKIYENVLKKGKYTEKDLSKLVDYVHSRKLIEDTKFLSRHATPTGLGADISSETRKLFIRKDFETAFREMGVWVDPSFRNSLRRFRAKNKAKEKLLLAYAVNHVSISTIGAPVYLPKVSLMRADMIPEHLYIDYMKDGFEATFPKILAHFKVRGYTSAMIKKGSSIYAKLGLMMVGVFVYKNWDLMKFGVNSFFITEEKLAEVQESTFDLEKAKLNEFESWKEGYFDMMDGEWPSEEEAVEEWNYISKKVADDFKVDYKNKD